MVATAAPETPVIDRSACPANRHGRATDATNHGCRCADSRAARRRQQKRWRNGLPIDPFVDGTGTQRRRNALLVMGWSCAEIGEAAGLAPKTIKCIGSRSGRTRQSTADRMRRAFDALSVLPRPEGRDARGRRTIAARLGYVAADEWIDIDDPAELPDRAYRADVETPADVSTLELREMVDLDWSLAAIIERTKLPEHAVVERLKNVGEMERRGRRAIPADTVYAIRDEYLRTRHTTWKGSDVARRWGVSTWTVSTVIHGTTRPELGLTDLTVQQGGRNQGSAA